MNFKRNSIWFLPLLAMISAPVWWSAAGDLLKARGGVENPTPPPPGQLKSFVMEEVLLTQYRDDREEFVLKAARVNSGIHEDVLELEKIDARLLGPAGRQTLLTGGEAFYDTRQQIITVIDNVRVQTAEGQEMRTESLRYLTRARKVETAEKITLDDGKGRVTGGNFLYDLVDGNYRVGGGVKVDLY